MIEMIGKGWKRVGALWRRRSGLGARGQANTHSQVFGGFSGAVLALAQAGSAAKPERGR